jgi:hypothetical protein
MPLKTSRIILQTFYITEVSLTLKRYLMSCVMMPDDVFADLYDPLFRSEKYRRFAH